MANWLVGAGAGIFLAPLWTVRDDLGLASSEAFYDELLYGKTVAEAMGAGRQTANREGDPTWLAYSMYAHPNARAVVGQGTGGGQPLRRSVALGLAMPGIAPAGFRLGEQRWLAGVDDMTAVRGSHVTFNAVRSSPPASARMPAARR
ncbi:MAG: hypothetical protein U0X20_12700 [Caldilineaceae bacterium]